MLYYTKFYHKLNQEIFGRKENKSLNKLKKELKEYGFKTQIDELGYVFIIDEGKEIIGRIEKEF